MEMQEKAGQVEASLAGTVVEKEQKIHRNGMFVESSLGLACRTRLCTKAELLERLQIVY